ncbi:MAG: hypothetical protein ACRYFW_06255 [Janthinobacterium lividum]
MMSSRHPAGRIALLALGGLLVAAAPVVGVLPGPGGIFLFAGGLALLLRNSARVRRWFVRAKRRWPRTGALADRAMRRPSARRRRERAARLAGGRAGGPAGGRAGAQPTR